MIDFLLATLFLTFQLALAVGTLVGLFLFACFAIGWVVEMIRRHR